MPSRCIRCSRGGSHCVVGQDGARLEALYMLESTMKGELWEVPAVPKIRVLAEQLAHALLSGARVSSRV